MLLHLADSSLKEGRTTMANQPRLTQSSSFSARLTVVLLRLFLMLTLSVVIFYFWRRNHHRIMEMFMP
jgi:hypothetical protein